MAKTWGKLLKIALNGWNGCKFIYMAVMAEITVNGCELLEMAGMAGHGWKLLEWLDMAENGYSCLID